MASITKRGSSYRITVSTGYDIHGKKIRKTTTFTPDKLLTPHQQEKAAKLYAAEFESKVLNGKILDGEKMTVQQFAYKWLAEYVTNREKTTYDSYKLQIDTKIIPALGHIKLSKLTPLHIQSFYNNLAECGVRLDGKDGSYSHGTIKKIDGILSSMLSTAVLWQLIEANPCNRVSIPKQNKQNESDEPECFTLEQAVIFLQALDMELTSEYKEHSRIDDTGKIYKVKAYKEARKVSTQFKVFFNIALFGGLRKGEILALTWKDIDFEKNTVTINKNTVYTEREVITKTPKNKTSNRTIVLPQSVIELIRNYKKEQYAYRLSIGDQWCGNGDYLFIQANGKQMHPSTPYHKFKKIIKSYNENAEPGKELPDIPLHALRHTSATLLIADNIDIRTVSARLGHAQTSTTMNIYAHALKELDQKAAAAMENMFNKKA